MTDEVAITDKVAKPETCLSYHIIDEAVLIPDSCLLILLPVAFLIHFCKDLQEAAIICLQDGVLGGQVQWPASTIHAS